MTTFRTFLILIGCVMLPVILGIAGFRVGSTIETGTAAALMSVGGFLIGCLPAVLLWWRTPRTGYPAHDDGDAGFWASGGASGGDVIDGDAGGDGGGDGGGD